MAMLPNLVGKFQGHRRRLTRFGAFRTGTFTPPKHARDAALGIDRAVRCQLDEAAVRGCWISVGGVTLRGMPEVSVDPILGVVEGVRRGPRRSP